MTMFEKVTHSTIPIIITIDYSLLLDHPGQLSDVIELLSGHLPYWMLSNEYLATLLALYQKVRGSLPVGMTDLQIVNELYEISKKNLRIVLSVSKPTDFYKLLQLAPLLTKHATLYICKPYEYNDLCQIAYQYFLHSSIDDYYIESLCNVVSSMYIDTLQIFPNLNPAYPQPTISNFVSLLERYSMYIDIMKPDRESRMEGLLLVIDSLSHIEKKLKSCQDEFTPLFDKYSTLQEKFKGTEEIFREAEETCEKYEKIENEMLMKREEEDKEFKIVEKKYKEAMKPFIDKVNKAADNVKRLPKQDLTQMQNLFRVTDEIKTVMYAVLILINHQTYEKWDDIMKWEMVKDLLENYEVLIKIEKFDLGSVPISVLDYLDNNFFNSLIYSLEERDYMFSSLQYFRDWTLVVAEACRQWWEYPKEREIIQTYNIKKEEYQTAFMKNHKKYIASKSIYDNLIKTTKDKKEEFNRVKDEYERAKSQIRNMRSFQEILLGEMKNFEEKQQYLSHDLANIDTNLLLYCGRLEFMGCMLESERSYVFDDWLMICDSYDLDYTQNLSLIDFFDIREQVYQWNIEGIPSSDYLIESMMIQGTSNNWCYLIDPIGIGIRWIQKYYDDRDIVMVNGGDKALNETVIDCLRRGAVLIIGSVTEQNKSLLEPLLYHALFTRDKIQINIENTIVDCKSDTVIFFYTDSNNFVIPEFLQNKVQIINLTTSNNSLIDPVLSLVLSYKNKSYKEENLELLENIKNKYVDYTFAESEMYKKFATLDDDFLTDDTSINELKIVKDKYVETKSEYEKIIIDFDKFKSKFNSYIPIIQNIADIYQTLIDILPNDPWSTFNFDSYIHLFYNTLSEASFKEITDRNIYDVLQDFTYRLYTNLAETTTLNIRLTVGLKLCLILYKCLDDYPDYVEDYIIQSYESNYKTEILPNVYVSQTQYSTIKNVSITLQPFKGLIDDIQRRQDIWTKLLNNNSPNLNLDLPQPYYNLTPFYQFILWRILKPNMFQEEVCYFISLMLKKPISLYQDIKIDRKLATVDIFTPILIRYNDENNYPLDMLNEIAIANNKGLVARSMCDVDTINKDIELARELGTWLLLLDVGTFTDVINKISLTGTKSTLKHSTSKGYRLFIITSSKKPLPYSFLRTVAQINMEVPENIKSHIKYSLSKPLIKNYKIFVFARNPIHKRLLYSLTFFSLLLLFRQNRYNENYYIGEKVRINDWLFLVDIYMRIILYYPPNSEEFWKAIRYIVCSIIYSSAFERIEENESIVTELYDKIISYELCSLSSTNEYSKIIYTPNSIHDLGQYLSFINDLPSQITDKLLGISSTEIGISYNTPSELLLKLIRSILAPETNRMSAFPSRKSVSGHSAFSLMPLFLKENYKSHIESQQYPLIELLELSIHDLFNIHKYIMNFLIKYITNRDNRLITSFLQTMTKAVEEDVTPDDWVNLWEYNSRKASEYVNYLTETIQYVNNVLGRHSLSFDLTYVRWPIGVIEAMRHIYANKLQSSISNISFKVTPLPLDYDNDPQFLPVSLHNGFYIKSLPLYNCYYNYDKQLIMQKGNAKDPFLEMYDEPSFPTLLFTPIVEKTNYTHIFRVDSKDNNNSNKYVIIPVYKDYGEEDNRFEKALFYFEVPSDPESNNWQLLQPYMLIKPE